MLPNGWRITPLGKAIHTEDMLLNIVPAPDGRAVIATHGGFNPHGLVVMDTATEDAVQRIRLKSAWLGLAWAPDGKRLFVSGGNANGRQPTKAPVYVFNYSAGKLSAKPVLELEDPDRGPAEIYWSGLVHHPKKNALYAANRGTGREAGYVAAFDTESNRLVERIQVEANPYDLLLSEDAQRLYVSNWSSASISVIDTSSNRVASVWRACLNPNDMELASDGRLFVACANENHVLVLDTKTGLPLEKIAIALTPNAPPGSTPNALAMDRSGNMLFVANADNNSIAIVSVAVRGRAEVLGFMPSGWYPSALYLDTQRKKLYVGNSKGMGSYSNLRGPHSPIQDGIEGRGSVKSLQKGSVNIVSVANLKGELGKYTRQVYQNVPYKDEYLAQAMPYTGDTVVPRQVGAGSPIKHVLYIIKENRTYDQVLGDIARGNGDSRLTIFGRDVTPNHHAIAEQFVLLDNLYCDGEVSVDGHSWSNSAIATDFNEKFWPPNYGGHSKADPGLAFVPSGGHIWDLAMRKGLTYRSYGEYAARSSEGNMEARPGVGGLLGHVSPNFKKPGMRDTENAKVFFAELDEYERNFESKDRLKRLPNLMVMSLPENHTNGTRPGAFTPRAMVASNDQAIGMIVERLTKSPYWKELAIFVIEDDAQDGPDHVDARRTVGLVVSPYTRRGIVDSTLYTTSSMLRTMELLLGLPPMTQFDASANPMYASFSSKADLAGYTAIGPKIDLDERNTEQSFGARASLEMDFEEVDRTPMRELNEIIWKSIRGAESEMPAPVHRFHFAGRRP
jgi:DNA-binding beta-propeller fold protein YncE